MRGLSLALGAIILTLVAGTAAAWGPIRPMPHEAPPWRQGAGASTAFHVEQRLWPAGYGIRVHLPDRRKADVQVSVEGNGIRIHSEAGQRRAPRGQPGPVLMQFGSFSQSLSLPPDADMRQMQVRSRGGVIEIFVPRRR